MRLLLDTHVVYWLLTGSRKLPASTKDMMLDPDNAVAVSVASIWEFAIKLSLGRIDYAGGVEDFGTEIVSVGFDIIPIAREHAEGVARLPPIHNDPFDRIIVATAIAEDMTLLSADDNIRKYAVKLGW